jgi:hypothetical protein
MLIPLSAAPCLAQGTTPNLGLIMPFYDSRGPTHALDTDMGIIDALFGPSGFPGPVKFATSTVANLPAPTTPNMYLTVTDGTTASDCTTGGATGGGAYRVLCRSNGSAWEAAGSGAGGGSSGGGWRIDKTVNVPTTADTFIKTKMPSASTLTGFYAECETSGGTVRLLLQQCTGNDGSCTTLMAATQVTCGTDLAATSGFSATAIGAGNWLNPQVTAVGSTAPAFVNFTITGTTP